MCSAACVPGRPGAGDRRAEADRGAAARAYPDTNAGKQGVRLEPLAELVVGGYRRTLVVLQVAVALVLLIACTNLANLLLARTAARRRELALRAALGARVETSLRQLLAETGTLGLRGGAFSGSLAAAFGVRALLALGPAQLPRAAGVGDGSAGPGVQSGALAGGRARLGLGPGAAGQPAGLAETHARGGPRKRDGRGRGRARAVLVAAEVGLSLVLLVGAGLLLRTLHRLQSHESGFPGRTPARRAAVAAEEPLRDAGGDLRATRSR